MQTRDFDEVVELIRKEDPRYERGAYTFIRHALDHTLKAHAKDQEKTLRHVRGQELLEGIREFALDQFGPLSLTVLNEWGIHKCKDFGHIVFNLVDYGLLGKTEQDSIEDFVHGYDFDEAFVIPFLSYRRLTKHLNLKEEEIKES
ncbi:MAG: hypothetical protein LAT55_11200 [Opitutales bacterium]|nr:hypothetical protein [Opitutales bacterium]